MLISKEQHWRSPAKKLQEELGNKLQGWQEKTQGKEKPKLPVISLKIVTE